MTKILGVVSTVFIIGFLAYGFLCRKFSLRTLLWIGSILTVPHEVEAEQIARLDAWLPVAAAH